MDTNIVLSDFPDDLFLDQGDDSLNIMESNSDYLNNVLNNMDRIPEVGAPLPPPLPPPPAAPPAERSCVRFMSGFDPWVSMNREQYNTPDTRTLLEKLHELADTLDDELNSKRGRARKDPDPMGNNIKLTPPDSSDKSYPWVNFNQFIYKTKSYKSPDQVDRKETKNKENDAPPRIAATSGLPDDHNYINSSRPPTPSVSAQASPVSEVQRALRVPASQSRADLSAQDFYSQQGFLPPDLQPGQGFVREDFRRPAEHHSLPLQRLQQNPRKQRSTPKARAPATSGKKTVKDSRKERSRRSSALNRERNQPHHDPSLEAKRQRKNQVEKDRRAQQKQGIKNLKALVSKNQKESQQKTLDTARRFFDRFDSKLQRLALRSAAPKHTKLIKYYLGKLEANSSTQYCLQKAQMLLLDISEQS